MESTCVPDLAEIAVYLGLDVGKGEHHAVALIPAGKTLHDKALPNSEPKLRALFTKLARHGQILVVVDQPASIGALPVTVARDSGCTVAYLPGLTMRRIADLYPGEAKTDARDAQVIADAARTMPHTLRDLEPDDETIAALHMLLGHDDDLPAEATRTSNRIRGLLTPIHPHLERVIGPRITHPAVLSLLIELRSPAGIRAAGLASVTRRSGSSIKGETRAMRGNRALKRALFQSAFASLSHPPSRTYYERKISGGKRYNQAPLGLARRRCDVLYAVIRNGALYQVPA